MIERIVGPIGGYFITSYACEMGELGDQYLGFSKVCAVKPPNYWEAKACYKFSSEHLSSTADMAMRRSETRAKMLIADMEHPAERRSAGAPALPTRPRTGASS